MTKPMRRRRSSQEGASEASQPGGRTAVPALALCSAVLLWASFPPLDFWLLAWVAPVPWLLLVRAQPKPRRLYAICYLAGLVYWLASTQWMRLGHPTMYTAWVALSVYLALGVVGFVWLCRQAVHRLRVPLLVAAPVTWVGLELLRAHLLGGFGWYFLGHTQYRWAALIQISDLVGAYGISFVMMLFAGWVGEALPAGWLACRGVPVPNQETGAPRRPWMRFGVVTASIVAALGYGRMQLARAHFTHGPTVALIQGNVPLTVKYDPGAAQPIFDKHVQMTERAAKRNLDLVIWPESMVRFPLVQISPQMTDARLREMFPEKDDFAALRYMAERLPRVLTDLSRKIGAGFLVGVQTVEVLPSGERDYNSAVHVTPNTGIAERYDKVHRVPFGEFLPLAQTLPWLSALTPFPKGYGVDTGRGPVALECDGYRFGVLICYEDTVPQLVRRFTRVGTGASPSGPQGKAANVDFLVNITNDGWFGASSELEQHLITSAFRAVECRTPLVRAANTGISAIIDGNGRIVPETVARDARSGRTKEVEAVVVAPVPLDNRRSLYVVWGDWFAAICLWASGGIAVWTLWDGLRRRQRSAAPTT